jgi:hypothetical protein
VLQKTGRLISRHTVEQLNHVDQKNLVGRLMEAIATPGATSCVYQLGITQRQQDLG